MQSGTPSVSISDTYTDLTDLGEIFGVEYRATAADCRDAGPSRLRPGQGGQPPTGHGVRLRQRRVGADHRAGLAMPTPLISLGGGTNIFAALKQSWTTVSWEQVVAAQPQCIIINDYGIPTAAQKEKFLETFAASKNLPAVKNRCFLPLSYDEVTPGPRNAEAVVMIAKWLHPSAFGLPPDGS